jgi:hypothetical protein
MNRSVRSSARTIRAAAMMTAEPASAEFGVAFLGLLSGSARFGAIATSFETSLRVFALGVAYSDCARLRCIAGITHSGVFGASPDRTAPPPIRASDKFRRREAPQYYPDATGRPMVHS